MTKEERYVFLIEQYEVLKKVNLSDFMEITNNFETLINKVIPAMLAIDTSTGVKMWQYLLNTYYLKCAPVAYKCLTDDAIKQFEDKIGVQALKEILMQNENIRHKIYMLDPYENHLYCEWFIRDLVLNKEYAAANELLSLYSQNKTGSLFSALHGIVNCSESRWKINRDGIEFVKRWAKLLSDKKQKATIDVSILELEDCVAGETSKGAMPFELFLELNKTGDALTVFENDRIPDKSELEFQPHVKEKTSSVIWDSPMTELNNMVGLIEVKEEVSSLVNLIKIRKIRTDRGINQPDISLHMAFVGNPGTGKTTVARLISQIYYSLGILSKGHLVETDRSGLVGGYVGQTAIKVKELVQKALGGVLFIDEADALAGKGENDFGLEAIETLLKLMEDNRNDLVVIVAGCPEGMNDFFDSNPGMRSRFNRYILFRDYTSIEMMSILNKCCDDGGVRFSDEARNCTIVSFDKVCRKKNSDFANGRTVRNYFESALINQANRLAHMPELTDEALALITLEDVQNIQI